MGSYVLLLDHWRGPPLHYYCPSHGPPTSLQIHTVVLLYQAPHQEAQDGHQPAGFLTQSSVWTRIRAHTLTPSTDRSCSCQLSWKTNWLWRWRPDLKPGLNGTPGCLTWIKSPMLTSSPTNLAMVWGLARLLCKAALLPRAKLFTCQEQGRALTSKLSLLMFSRAISGDGTQPLRAAG